MPLFPFSMRYFRVSSKSPTVPPFHTRKVLCLILVSASSPVLPVIAPSWTDQSLGFPSHPERSLPLKRFFSSAAAPRVTRERTRADERSFIERWGTRLR